MKKNNYTFQIYYSKKYKLFDLVIKQNNEFIENYHVVDIKEMNKLIAKYLKKII